MAVSISSSVIKCLTEGTSAISVANSFRSVVMEPKQVTVLTVCGPKGGIFIGQGLPEIRAFQLFGQPFGFLREPVSFNLCKATQIPCFPGLIAEIVVKIPKL